MEQLNHYNTDFENKQFPITVVCDEVYFQDNIGSIFRVCDAFGVSKIIFTGDNFVFSERKINKTSRSTQKNISFEIIQSKDEVIQYLENTNSEIIALEITDISSPINNYKHKQNSPITLIIGNEIHGVSKDFLQLAKKHFHITMFGKNSSMNVVQSLSIALYEITKTL